VCDNSYYFIHVLLGGTQCLMMRGRPCGAVVFLGTERKEGASEKAAAEKKIHEELVAYLKNSRQQ